MSDDLSIDIRLLGLFLADPAPLLIYPMDAAAALGADRKRVYRELAALAGAGWLIESEHTRSRAYRLGPNLLRLRESAIDGALRECDLAMRAIASMGDAIRACGGDADARCAPVAHSHNAHPVAHMPKCAPVAHLPTIIPQPATVVAVKSHISQEAKDAAA